jgi:hypothetical protein
VADTITITGLKQCRCHKRSYPYQRCCVKFVVKMSWKFNAHMWLDSNFGLVQVHSITLLSTGNSRLCSLPFWYPVYTYLFSDQKIIRQTLSYIDSHNGKFVLNQVLV